MDTRVVYNKSGKKNGYLPDNFERPPDWENEYSEEDEVFVESPSFDGSGASKPLMYPRARTKTRFGRGGRCRCRPVVHAVCCFLFLVLTLGSLMGLVVYYVNKHNNHTHTDATGSKTVSGDVNFRQHKLTKDFTDVIGCDEIVTEDVWVVGIPKLLTESAVRLVDVNQDGVLDVILGFATGADGYGIPSIVCDIYFDGTYPCFGGLIALEGATGIELWRHYSEHEIYGVTCNVDLNKDGVNDCLGGGRAGAFQAISGKDGSLIWNFGKQEAKNDIMNLYTAQIIPDLDNDGTVDILAIHGGDPLQDPGSKYRLSGRLLLMSGRTGKVIRWMGVPDDKESYYSPQVYTLPDGSQRVLFGTGGETHGGSLWVVNLADLFRGDISRAQPVFTDTFKGVMTPPALVDITGDGTEDIIVPVFNSSVLAIDGVTYKLIWNQTFPQSESYNTPAPGYYNDDDIPDFLVKYAYGPGFPVYYHSVTTVLDGRTGKPLIDPPIRDTVGAQASGLTVSVEGLGNDIFLYWAANCKDHDGQGGEFKFVKGTNVHEQSRSDFCRLRFKTKGYSKVYAISQHIPGPGTTVYNSEDRLKVEHSKWINTTEEGLKFVLANPEYLEEYSKFSAFENVDTDTMGDLPNQDNSDIRPIPQEAGSEVPLFETPMLDPVQQTSRKKGPKYPQYKQPYQSPNNGIDRGIPDYDYSSNQYYNNELDPYEGNTNGAFTGRRRYNKDGVKDFPYYSDTKDYMTTPRYRLPYRTNQYKDKFTSRPKGLKPKIPYEGSFQRRKGRSSNGQSHIFDDNSSYTDMLSVENSSRNTRTSTSYRKQEKRKRQRRHVGPHDEKGLQRLLSTGTLAPTSLPKDHPNFNNSIEFVFATYWFFPAKTKAILPADQKCIEKKLSEETIRFDITSRYYGMDHDAYEHAITDECLAESAGRESQGDTFESQVQYNPFNVHMGQMTVYRVRLTCTCSNQTRLDDGNKRCGRILPFSQQEWHAYMGNMADSHWRPRQHP